MKADADADASVELHVPSY